MRASTSASQACGSTSFSFAGDDQAVHGGGALSARDRSRRRATTFCRAPSPVHSAHVGQELEVHYRWHPYFGCKVVIRRVAQRATGRFLEASWVRRAWLLPLLTGCLIPIDLRCDAQGRAARGSRGTSRIEAAVDVRRQRHTLLERFRNRSGGSP